MQYKRLNGNPKTEIKLFFLLTFLKQYELILMYLLKLALDNELDRGWPAACARCLKVTRTQQILKIITCVPTSAT